jgi:hypothetical protein
MILQINPMLSENQSILNFPKRFNWYEMCYWEEKKY